MALFAITAEGQLSVSADGRPPTMGPDDTVLVLATVRDF